jgi:3-oxoacyl-[acyl-carrier-protein] synthase II
MDEREKVVITGAALVSGLGLSRAQTWDAVLKLQRAAGPMLAMESPLPAGKDGGQAPDLPADFAPDLPRESRYLKWAMADALRDASATPQLPYPARRCSILLGTTLHGMRAAGRYFRSNDLGTLRDFPAGATLAAAAADLGFHGRANTLCSACSSSLSSVAMAVTLLQNGDADLVLTGGYDTISEYVYGGFASLRLVADGPLRPFARDRQGMKLAEGYGILVLERTADAHARGAAPLATILGWGESSDSHHLTQPHPQGEGAAAAVRAALSSAHRSPTQIDLIAAHATGTPDNDAAEHAAFSQVFGPHLPQVPVVAFKSHLGHTLGGAGAVELVLSAVALRDGMVPACASVTADEMEFPGLAVTTLCPRPATLGNTLNTSLGFGGANTAMVLGTPPARPVARALFAEHIHRPRATNAHVFITGIGVILPGVIGNDALVAHLRQPSPDSAPCRGGDIPDRALEGLLAARRVRRMSQYVKLTLAAATLACRDAGLAADDPFLHDCAAVLGTTHGASNFSVAYYRQLIAEGIAAANPLLFAEAVPNIGAAQLSLMLSLKGASQTVIGTRTAGLDAMALAAARIRSGDWSKAIVGAGEEHCDLVANAHRHCRQNAQSDSPASADALVTSSGAVVFVLESRDSMERRGGAARGRIEATAATFGTAAQLPRSAAAVLQELGTPLQVICSAGGPTLDRAEAAAIRHTERSEMLVSSLHGHVAELFSATPLVGIAGALLSGRLPAMHAPLFGPRGATGHERATDLAALCTDISGVASGVRVKLL